MMKFWHTGEKKSQAKQAARLKNVDGDMYFCLPWSDETAAEILDLFRTYNLWRRHNDQQKAILGEK